MEQELYYTESIEKLRQKTMKTYKNAKFTAIIIAIIYLLFAIFIKSMSTVPLILSGKVALTDILIILLPSIMMCCILSITGFGIHILIASNKIKKYQNEFKRNYVVQILNSMPDFRFANYEYDKGFTYEEISKLSLIPYTIPTLLYSSDLFTGELNGINFKFANIETQKPNKNHAPITLFSGQIIQVSLFGGQKITSDTIQIIPTKKLKDLKSQKSNIEIGEIFNKEYKIFADSKDCTFNLLNPTVIKYLEDFIRKTNKDVYILFSNEYMYIAIDSQKILFNSNITIPATEQLDNIKTDTLIINKITELFSNIEKASNT